MSWRRRLVTVGSLSESLGLYVSAKVFQKALGIARVLLLAWMLGGVEYGLWGLGMLLVTVAAPLLTLGANLGLERYVSFHDARGQSERFYRQVRWTLVLLAGGLWLVAMLASGPITRLVIQSRHEPADVAFSCQLWISWLALANALAAALLMNLTSFLYGLRAYRLVAAMEAAFAIAFTIVVVGALLIWPTTAAALVSHLLVLLATLAWGTWMLHRTLAELPQDAPADAPRPALDRRLGRILRFGFASLWGAYLWQWIGLLGFWLVSRQFGKVAGGVFYGFLLLGQMVTILAEAAWSVVYTHTARMMEAGRTKAGRAILQAAYKTVALAMMTLTLAIYIAAPLWVRLLPERFAAGQDFFGGLFSNVVGGILLFYQVVVHLALMTLLARLDERPWAPTAAAAAGGGAILLLARAWMPYYGPAGAAWSAGVGMLLGAGAVSLAYFVLRRPGLGASCYVVFAAPVVLLLPSWIAGGIWLVVLLVATWTNWLLTADQRGWAAAAVRELTWMLRQALRPARAR